MPLFAAIEQIPEQYAKGNTDYDDESAYWKFRGSFALTYGISNDEKGQITEYWKSVEQKSYIAFDLFCSSIKGSQELDEFTECFARISLCLQRRMSLRLLLIIQTA